MSRDLTKELRVERRDGPDGWAVLLGDTEVTNVSAVTMTRTARGKLNEWTVTFLELPDA